MTRKLALLLAACLGLWHGSAWALGLGEIEARSSLNERFSATIDLRRIESLSQNEIIASLASAEDFSRLGVQRFFYLSELEFSTDLSDRGRPRIVVSSSRPINEPFVNFVVDVRWPTGRMLREYMVLLDPPTYAERPTPAVRPAETAAPAAAPARAVTTPRAAPTQVRTEAQPSPGAGRLDGDRYGVTDRNDTLWAIALTVRPSTNVSVQQTMLALQRLNPDAFIGGNINLLKAGYVLQVPTADEIARLTRQDAVVQVAEHNARWRAGTPAMPVDARPELTSVERPARPAGELRLVAGEDDDVRVSRETPPAGTVSGGAADALRGDLAAAESRLSEAEAGRRAAERQRQEATSELEEVRRQLELRNQELARLQRQLAEQQQTPAPASRPPAQGPLGMDWMLLAAGLLGLIIIVAAALLLLRRRRNEGDDGLAAEEEEKVDAGSEPAEQTQLMSAISKEDLARTGVAAAVVAGGDDESDVIAEADVYMAYGRFSEAARVLNSAIEADGQRADLRLKLMEVLVETQDVQAFNTQAEALRGFADEQTIDMVDDLASRLPGAVTSTGATSRGEAAGSTRDADEGEVSLDFDLGDDFDEPADLDSLDIDFVASSGPKMAAAPAAADSDDDLTLVLDGDDDGKTGNTDAALDLDFHFDQPADSSPKPAPSTYERDDELDLGLELDGDDVALEDSSLADTLAHDESAATRATVDDGEEDLSLFDEPAQAGRSGTEEVDADPEFDLTMDGTGFIKRPQREATATAEDEGEVDDLEFDLGGGAGDAPDEFSDADASAGREPLSAQESAETDEDGDDDLNFDFELDDLPADTPKAQVGNDLSATVSRGSDDDDSANLSATVSRGSDDDDSDDDEITLFRAAAAGTEEDLTELSLDDADEDEAKSSAPAASNAVGELPVDLAEDDFEFGMDFDDAGDETTTKLELARAYIDMGDEDGAKEILDEVVRDGSDTQQQEAAELLARLG